MTLLIIFIAKKSWIRGTYLGRICYYDPWSLGVTLQSPQSTTTPRVLTLISIRTYNRNFQAEISSPKSQFEVVLHSKWQIVSWRYDVIIGSFQHLIKIEARPFFLVRGWQVFTQYSSFAILPIRALTFSIDDAILWCRYVMMILQNPCNWTIS